MCANIISKMALASSASLQVVCSSCFGVEVSVLLNEKPSNATKSKYYRRNIESNSCYNKNTLTCTSILTTNDAMCAYDCLASTINLLTC